MNGKQTAERRHLFLFVMNALSRSNAREISHFSKIVMGKLDFHPGVCHQNRAHD